MGISSAWGLVRLHVGMNFGGAVDTKLLAWALLLCKTPRLQQPHNPATSFPHLLPPHTATAMPAGGLLEIMLMSALGGVGALFIGASVYQGAFLGALVAMSSTSIVVKCLNDRRVQNQLPSQITIATLVLQVGHAAWY